jgi:hypothetical protein
MPPTGSVTKANIKLSLESGRAFVDFNGDELSDWIGHKITIRDSANRELVGYIKAAGTGETYGSEILSNTAFESTANLWVDDSTVASVAGGQDGRCLRLTSSGSGSVFSAGESRTCIDGALLRGSIYVKSGTGTRQKVTLGLAGGDWHTWNVLFNGNATADWTPYSAYGTADDVDLAMIYSGYVDPPTAGETRYFDTASVKQVLTPSATGVTITSSAYGSVYDWSSEESGFNRNDYFGYTYEIEIVSVSLSPSASPSVSPSASPSLSPSISPSVSPSASLSPSLSPSVSPSASLSPSLSPSISPSVSPSPQQVFFDVGCPQVTAELESYAVTAELVSYSISVELESYQVTAELESMSSDTDSEC